MAKLGFTTYITPEPVPQKTTKELLSELSNSEKVAILDGFCKKVLPKNFRIIYEMRAPSKVVKSLYQAIDAVEEKSRALMRGEVILEEAIPEVPAVPEIPEVLDENGDVIQEFVEGTPAVPEVPAVYNTPPETIAALEAELAPLFSESFTAAQVGAIVNKMVAYSEIDADGEPIGTAATYLAEVVK